MEPKGKIVLDVPTLPVETVSAFRWMLLKLGWRDRVAELDSFLKWNGSEAGRRGWGGWLGRFSWRLW